MDDERQSASAQERIAVTVKVFGAHRERFGSDPRRIEIRPGGTLRDVLAALDELVPDLAVQLQDGLDKGYLQILVNGRNAQFLDRLDSRLAPDDTVAFLPPIGGG